MRVLVVTVPAVGHLLPMVPLVSALVAQGDEVTVATHPSLGHLVEPTGAAVWPAGHQESVWFERLAARTRATPGDGVAAGRIDHYFVPRAFAEIGADDLVDDVLACAHRVEPDLVVFESYALVGPLVATLVAARMVQHLLGPTLAPDVLELANDAVSPLWRAHGLDVPGHAGVYEGVTILLCPPGMVRDEVPRGTSLMLRPCPLPESARVLTPRPLVYVTLGTMFANVGVFQAILWALADEPLDVLVTMGADGDPSDLEPWPANATVERFVAQSTLLPRCAAVVHHGGSGTTFGALAHGIPQVVLPQGADNFRNATLLEATGAGRTVLPDDVAPEAIRRAVRGVLDDPGGATAAAVLAGEIAAMPTAGAVAAELRAFATG